MREATAYVDGSGNSDRIQACACVLTVDSDTYECSLLLQPGTTNNVGEYRGVLLAVRTAKKYRVDVLHIRSDSKLIVHQLRGDWLCQNNVLRELRDQVRLEAQSFLKIDIEWVPRTQNKRADELCRKAIAKYQAELFSA